MKTMASHFHNEFISSVVLAGKPVPEKARVYGRLKKAGLNIASWRNFHGRSDIQQTQWRSRIKESCTHYSEQKGRRLSDTTASCCCPSEEANNFMAGTGWHFSPNLFYLGDIEERGCAVYHERRRPNMAKCIMWRDKTAKCSSCWSLKKVAWVSARR